MEEIKKKKKCVSPEQLANLESIVRELSVRLTTVEDCLLGLDGMRDRMRHLEKSMENALDRIMPRLDALLAGLPANVTRQITAKPPIVPLPSSSSQPASLASPSSSSNCAVKGKDSCTSKTASYAHVDNNSRKNIDPKNRNMLLNGEKQRSTSSAALATKPATEKKKKNSANEKETKKVTSSPAHSVTTPNEKTLPSSSEGDSCAGASSCESDDVRCSYKSIAERRTKAFLEGAMAGVLAVLKTKHENGALPQREQSDAEINEITAKLQKAALRGDLLACTMLVGQGASVAKRDPVTGDSALLCAMRGGNLACISFLMEVVKVTHGVTDLAQAIASSSKHGTASTKAAARKRKTTGKNSTGGEERSPDTRSQGAAVSQNRSCRGQPSHAGSPTTSKVQTSNSTENQNGQLKESN